MGKIAVSFVFWIILLTACRAEPDSPLTNMPACSAETVPEEIQLTPETMAETEIPVMPERLPETEPEPVQSEETAYETDPPETEAVVLHLPDEMITNITTAAADEILRQIADAFKPYPDAAVYFTDVNEEYFFGIRENLEFHSASTIKAPYCQYLAVSGADLFAEIPFTQSNRSSASGMLGADAVGQSFTLLELIEYTIRYSDNQAYKLLYDTYGTEDYNRYVESIGAEGLALDNGSEWAYVTPKELSRAMTEIHRTSEENGMLTDFLRQTTFNAQIAAGTQYETAHKYGYNGGADGYHDTAIVYAPGRAYVLTVMTHMDFAVEDDANALFRTAAALCDQLHEVLYGGLHDVQQPERKRMRD